MWPGWLEGSAGLRNVLVADNYLVGSKNVTVGPGTENITVRDNHIAAQRFKTDDRSVPAWPYRGYEAFPALFFGAQNGTATTNTRGAGLQTKGARIVFVYYFDPGRNVRARTFYRKGGPLCRCRPVPHDTNTPRSMTCSVTSSFQAKFPPALNSGTLSRTA